MLERSWRHLNDSKRKSKNGKSNILREYVSHDPGYKSKELLTSQVLKTHLQNKESPIKLELTRKYADDLNKSMNDGNHEQSMSAYDKLQKLRDNHYPGPSGGTGI